MSFYVDTLIEYLNHHPTVGLVFTFIIAMIESIAILGTIIPGMLTMTIVGMLVGSGILPLGLTLFISIIGALTGDFLSYWFGLHYRNHIYQMWPFKKYQKFLLLGEKFFAKHGGKSVVIGRFVGPVRSMVPLIAGLLQMRLVPFALAAILSATSWSIIYMFPGIFLGALSMELPKWKALEFLGYALLWIFLIWVAIWLTKYLIWKTWRYVDHFLEICWRYLKEHPKTGFLLQWIINPRNPYDHRQFTLLFLGFILALLFIWSVESVHFQGFITQWDLPLFHLLQSFRTPTLDRLMLGISFLFSGKALIPASLILFAVFIWKRAFWMGFHFLGIVLTSTLLIKLTKWCVPIHRPPTAESVAFATDIFSSFPSGHVGLALSVLGFSAVLISTELTGKGRKIPYLIVLILVFLIALSRLYLGAHWFSDVLGSVLLNGTCLLFFTVSYRRSLNHLLSARFLIGLFSTVFLICCLMNGILYRKDMQEKPKLPIPNYMFSKETWWENRGPLPPLYRNNRFGKPIQILNLSWLGDLPTIRQILLKKGWVDEQAETEDFKKMVLKNLIKPKEAFKLPMLPALYQGQPPVLIMTRRFGSDWIVLELWASHIHLKSPQKGKLWVGIIYTQPHPHKWFAWTHHASFKDAIQPLLSDIRNETQSKTLTLPANRLPKKLGNIKFEKDVYFIKIQTRAH